MKRLLIIGFGNPLRSDDGIGPVLAELLEQRLASAPVDVIVRQQLMPELVIPISEAEAVLFLDADARTRPAEITFQRLATDIPPEIAASAHEVSPEWLLAQSQLLYHTAPEACLVTIGGEYFGYGMQLSKTLRAALPDLLERLLHWIERVCDELAKDHPSPMIFDMQTFS